MKKTLLAISISCIGMINCALAQKTDTANEKIKLAVHQVDSGHVDKGIAMLKEAQKLDPKNADIAYELAYAFYAKKDYQQSVDILTPLVKKAKVEVPGYQLLGNAYDELGQSDQAIFTYQQGLKKFPNAGPLFLENGIILLKKEKYNEALALFESGIKSDPKFASNYFWAAKLYFNTTSEVYGMLYGEIFINLQPHTKRAIEMSKLLFNIYDREIKFVNDTSVSVSFCQDNQVVIKGGKPKLPFGTTAYEMSLLIALHGEHRIDLDVLSKARTNFINAYYQKWDKDFPNVLFDYNKKINDAGHADAYNHWLLMQGSIERFKLWASENKDKLQSFFTWYQQNRLQLDSEHRFYSSQYK